MRLCSCLVAQSCLSLCDPMDCSMPGLPVLHHLLEFPQTQIHWVDDATQPSHLLFPSSLIAFNLSQHQGLFQWVGSSHQVAKGLEFQLQHQSLKWVFKLISLRIDLLDLLAVQGTLTSLLQHHNLKASVSQCSAFFMVQLLHPYTTTGKTTALIIQAFVGRMMSLLFTFLFPSQQMSSRRQETDGTSREFWGEEWGFDDQSTWILTPDLVLWCF